MLRRHFKFGFVWGAYAPAKPRGYPKILLFFKLIHTETPHIDEEPQVSLVHLTSQIGMVTSFA